jgi:hypothetical protein
MAKSRHFDYVLRDLKRGKSAINDILYWTVQGQKTFQEFLAMRREMLLDQPWYQNLPRWAKAELDGYMEPVIGLNYNTRLTDNHEFAHVYEGKLYRKYDQWRRDYPDAKPSTLGDSCVTVWKSTGKVFSGPFQGETFPFAE